MRASLVPLPASVEFGAGEFSLTPDTWIGGDPEAVAWGVGLLRERTGLQFGGPGPGGIEFLIEPGGPAESYRIVVGSDEVRVTGADAAGLCHAGSTLAQLASPESGGWVLPEVVIQDAPRFAWRGAMLDVARHFFGVEVVKRLIDQLARLKFNVLHLHLSDDHGWRIGIASRPELTGKAAGSSCGGGPGGHFTQADYAEIVAYAASRHLTVVPEIDLPGHTHAVGVAYPELAEQPSLGGGVLEEILDSDKILPAAGLPFTGEGVGFSCLKIHDEAVYAFLADVLDELTALTPGPYLHVGGDECLTTPATDYAAFLRRVTGMVAERGKIPVAWFEAGAAAGLAPGTIGQYWGLVAPDDRAVDFVGRLVAAGSQLVLSPADAVYLDMKPTLDSPGNDWAAPVVSLRDSYDWEPAKLVEGIGEADIRGVEAALWTERVATPAQIDALLFPRLAAVAEIAWSAPAGSPGRTWPDFRNRIAGIALMWHAQGVGFTPDDEVAWS